MSRSSTYPRDLRVDVVRGLALVSMYVAHGAPSGGPGNSLTLSEYLTYPLFAALVGTGAELSGRRLGGRASLAGWWGVAVRGAVLVVVGILLDRAGAQVVVVLVYLGLLTWLAAPLARARSSVVVGTAVAAFALAPLGQAAVADDRIGLLQDGAPARARVLEVLLAGESYRLSSMVLFACVGILLARWLLDREPSVQLRTGGVAVVLAAAFLVAAETGLFVLAPYDATHAEHLFDVLLVVGVVALGVGIAGRVRSATAPLAWIGQMSLTLYSAQIAWLAYDVRVLHPGEPDDSWLNVAILVVGSFVLAGTWRLAVRRGAWRRGPLEGATDALAHVVPAASRRPTPTRPARSARSDRSAR